MDLSESIPLGAAAHANRHFSFRPIDLDLSCSSDSLEAAFGETSPNEIFRDTTTAVTSSTLVTNSGDRPLNYFRDSEHFNDDKEEDDTDAMSLPSVRRANPIRERSSASLEAAVPEINDEQEEEAVAMMDSTFASRVISPYPFSTSREEIEDREQLTTTSLHYWAISPDADQGGLLLDELKQRPVRVDFSRFFEFGTVSNQDDFEMECDDFSLSSQEANSICKDLGLEAISEDPTSFWEEGIEHVATTEDRSHSPTQISVGSSDQSGPMASEVASPDQQ